MYHEKLNYIKETLMCAVEMQLCNLDEVDTKELGEAIDMIKDLEEAIYYCTVTEAMQGGGEMEMEMKGSEKHYKDSGNRMYSSNWRYPMMYRDDDRRRNPDGTFYMDSSNNNGRNYNDENMYRDEREGRSYNSRRMYMEAKEHKMDKAAQLKELEKYSQELTQDVVDMISDASPEERQYLEKKISALATKIGQMK